MSSEHFIGRASYDILVKDYKVKLKIINAQMEQSRHSSNTSNTLTNLFSSFISDIIGTYNAPIIHKM